MVVYEIKPPGAALPPPPGLKKTGRDIDPVFDIELASSVKRFERAWLSSRDQGRRDRQGSDSFAQSHETVRELVDQANRNLEKSGIQVHLQITRDENGFSVEVYDCSNSRVCEVVRDLVIDLEDIPALIRKLQQETGFIIDTIS